MQYIDESYNAQINKKVVLQVVREKILPNSSDWIQCEKLDWAN